MARRAVKRPAKTSAKEPDKKEDIEDDRKVPTLIMDYLVEVSEVARAMNPENTLPEHLFNAMLDLTITAAHERRCEAQWFLELVKDCMKARSLVSELRAETAILDRLDLPLKDVHKHALKTAADLTNHELVSLRNHLTTKLKLMSEMRPHPTVKVN